jgi:alpha-tubulin suppressor-like RCC1 family protein
MWCHSCAVVADGTARCWGSNTAGALGTGGGGNKQTPATVNLPSGVSLISIEGGTDQTCATTDSGSALCWGSNTYGKGGFGDFSASRTSPEWVTVATNVTEMAPGNTHTCGLHSYGKVSCWGNNNNGQLGYTVTAGTTCAYPYNWPCQSYPSHVDTLAGAVSRASISAGAHFRCAVRGDGTVRCWGMNFVGQLGDGTNTSASSAVPVSQLTGAVAVSSGEMHTCALTAAGKVFCWGMNAMGALGNGTTMSSNVPVQVPNLSDVKSVAAGYHHTCALRANGVMYCWGDAPGVPVNADGYALTPQQALTGVDQIASGDDFLCAIKTDRTLWCWGSNSYGQLGLGDTVSRATPTKVGNLSDVLGMSLGESHMCVLRSNENVYCWGRNHVGQLGLGNYSDTTQMTGPVVDLPASVVAMSGAGAFAKHTCAVTAAGATMCWGGNSGYPLGNNTMASSNKAILVTGQVLGSSVAIAATGSGTCTIRSDGAPVCWGSHAGNGTSSAQPAPVLVLNF